MSNSDMNKTANLQQNADDG